MPPDRILARLAEIAPGFVPDTLDYAQRRSRERGGAAPSAPGGSLTLRVSGHDAAHVMRGPNSGFATLDPITGALLWKDYLPGQQSAGFAALTSFFALHFGSYGGAPIRWAYLILGFAGAFLFYTGSRLWIAVRRRREKASGQRVDTRGTLVLSRLTTGCCTGCMAGIALILGAGLVAPGLLDEQGTYRLYQGVFWLLMVLSFLHTRMEGVLLRFTGALHALLAIIVLYRGGGTDFVTWSVVLIALGLAVSLIYLARRMSKPYAA